MNFDLLTKIKTIDMNFATIFFGTYIIAIGVAYYFIYKEHHKRNKVELDELVTLVSKFYVTTIITTLLIILGIFCIIGANEVKDTRNELIASILVGICIITVGVINFVFYIKRTLKDMDATIREKVRKTTIKIGEILELIFFIIFILMPIWRIPKFIEVIDNRKDLIIELVRAFGLCIASLLLLNSINPLDIIGKIKKIFSKEDTKLK